METSLTISTFELMILTRALRDEKAKRAKSIKTAEAAIAAGNRVQHGRLDEHYRAFDACIALLTKTEAARQEFAGRLAGRFAPSAEPQLGDPGSIDRSAIEAELEADAAASRAYAESHARASEYLATTPQRRDLPRSTFPVPDAPTPAEIEADAGNPRESERLAGFVRVGEVFVSPFSGDQLLVVSTDAAPLGMIDLHVCGVDGERRTVTLGRDERVEIPLRADARFAQFGKIAGGSQENELRELAADLAVLTMYDLLREISRFDFGSGQRARELNRRRREVESLLGQRHSVRLPELSARDLLDAFERVGAPRLARAYAETYRHSTPSTTRTIDTWRRVRRMLERRRLDELQRLDDEQRALDENDEQRDYAEERANAELLRDDEPRGHAIDCPRAHGYRTRGENCLRCAEEG